MPAKPAAASAYEWPFDETDVRQPDGTYVRVRRGDAPSTPAADESAPTPEES